MTGILLQQSCENVLVDVQVEVGILVHDTLQIDLNDLWISAKVEVQNAEGQLHQFGTVKEAFQQVGLCPVNGTAVLVGQLEIGQQVKQAVALGWSATYPVL